MQAFGPRPGERGPALVNVLVGGRWRGAFLDYWRGPEEYRVEVHAWRVVAPLENLYFVRPRSGRLLLNYLRELGIKDVVRKVRSRVQETARNEKFVSCGVGTVLAGPRNGLDTGTLVAFVAPSHPACVERLVIPPELVRPLDGPPRAVEKPADGSVPREILYLDSDEAVRTVPAPISGWSRFAEIPLKAEEVRATVDRLVDLAYRADWPTAQRLPRSNHTEPSERCPAQRAPNRPRKPSAVLFGYGNYAKTAILPNVRHALHLEAVHEIDAMQIPSPPPPAVQWDTAPLPRAGDRFDVCFVAGYHSTHVPVAIEALRRGACVVLEKPIATTEEQLDALLAAMEQSPAPLFCCFQRRYSPLTALARADLGAQDGRPVSYHCIVYEVPLPSLHWYRWPASGSRLLSNGCHWIDHFLHLNDFCPVEASNVFVAGDGTINCSLELENGAVFSMVLTESGSERLGVRDHVELRAGDVTVAIEDNSRYRAENSRRVLRRRRLRRGASYRVMYREIANAIAAARPGDSPGPIRCSAEAVLTLEQRLQGKIPSTRAGEGA
jgi:predicted dehydrogenase